MYRTPGVEQSGTGLPKELRRLASRGILSLLTPPENVHAPRTSDRVPVHSLDSRARISTLVEIAATNGSTVSSEELRVLLPVGLFSTAESLEGYIRADPVLSESLIILDGEVAPRGAEKLVARKREQRKLTSDRIDLASAFASRLARRMPWMELISLSGSTAYGGAKPHDDVDFFVVTERDRMWITLLVALVLARLERLRSRDAPVLCFNRVTERDACLRSFDDGHDPLFAREALNLRILRGQGFYRKLLENARWMEEPFPTLYDSRLHAPAPQEDQVATRRAPQWSAANALAFLGLAPYLWVVGLVRNARLDRDGHRKAHFRTVIERDFCAYESRKYDDLREAYRRAF
jgi:hypothetical protein